MGGQAQPTVGVTVTEVTQNGANGVSNGDKINGGVENVKDVNEKGKDLSVRLISSFRYW